MTLVAGFMRGRGVLIDHLSTTHGIDIPSKIRITGFTYLKRHTEGTLRLHIEQEAKELNELNTQIRRVECLLFLDARAVDYKRRHDSTLLFPGKRDLVSYLQRIRKISMQVESLYTKPGVMDTRDGVLDDLEMLLGWP